MKPASLHAGATALALSFLLSACGGAEEAAVAPEAAAPVAEATAAETVPEAVNGWREYPLRKGVISIEEAGWRTDVVDVPVPGKGGWLEYKLAMKAGDTVVYSISYEGLEHPGMMTVEFHGHTEKDASGVGDLMFYSKTSGVAESGSFTAPWDGVHGWYLKNDGASEAVAKLKLAGFYEIVPE
jgi:hypothetical protein